MPTKLEQVIALLGSMSKLELESTNAAAQAHIERLPDTTKCHLLNLPAELRNDVYYYVGIIQLREYGNTERCGLLGVNKQVRVEFMDVFYSGEVATLYSSVPYQADGKGGFFVAFQAADGGTSLKKLLDGLEGITKIKGTEFVHGDELTKDVRRELRQMTRSRGEPTSQVLGYLEVNGGSDGARRTYFSCWIHQAKQYGLTYEIPEGYPEELLPSDVSEEELV